MSPNSTTLAFDWHIDFWPWPIIYNKVNRNSIVEHSITELRCNSPHASVYYIHFCNYRFLEISFLLGGRLTRWFRCKYYITHRALVSLELQDLHFLKIYILDEHLVISLTSDGKGPGFKPDYPKHIYWFYSNIQFRRSMFFSIESDLELVDRG